jgi:SAM-dependent methyltransferase
MSVYNHEGTVHNLKDPDIIVPEIMKLLNPKSVVDIGCGLGTFLNVFKRMGVNDILGIDGPWVNKKMLNKYIAEEEFKEFNLEQEIKLDKKYDLVLSLEVAEHLKKDSADIFVKNLVNSGNLILFSAAIPNQGGQNHINEQWLTFWEEKFLKHNYIVHDIIRPIFWDNPEVFYWYKQNMVLIAPENFDLKLSYNVLPIRNIVHYELLNAKSRKIDEILTGKKRNTFYIKLLLNSLFGFNFVKKFTKNDNYFSKFDNNIPNRKYN